MSSLPIAVDGMMDLVHKLVYLHQVGKAWLTSRALGQRYTAPEPVNRASLVEDALKGLTVPTGVCNDLTASTIKNDSRKREHQEQKIKNKRPQLAHPHQAQQHQNYPPPGHQNPQYQYPQYPPRQQPYPEPPAGGRGGRYGRGMRGGGK